MPKKTVLEKEREFCEKCYFRWEFLRRNNEYQSDYKVFLDLFGDWFFERGIRLDGITGYSSVLLPIEAMIFTSCQEKVFYLDQFYPYTFAFLYKWGVQWPCRPDFTFRTSSINPYVDAALTKYVGKTPILDLRGDLQWGVSLNVVLQHAKRKMSSTYILREFELSEEQAAVNRKDEVQQPQKIPFEIILPSGKDRNLRRFYEKLREIEDRGWWPQDPKPEPTGSRSHLKKYPHYLVAWDARTRNPTWPWKKIAEELYPEEYAKSQQREDEHGERNKVVLRVMKQYEAAERLISGDLQKIR